MQQPNPYQSPSAEEAAPASELVAVARLLQDRRHATNQFTWQVKYALAKTWKAKVLSATAAILIAWYVSRYPMLRFLTWLLPTVLVTTWLRDLRWYYALAKQWPNTEHLLDWDRIDKLA